MLTPPPPAPPDAPSFHTTSFEIWPLAAASLVPPQANANGLEAGKSACGFPSQSPLMSAEPLSPEATHTVTPIAVASRMASFNPSRNCLDPTGSSGPPQLMEITDGLRTVSCAAALTASINPFVVFGA